MLTLLKSCIAGRRRLSKGSSKIERGNVLPSLVFQFLKNWYGNLAHRSPRGFRSNTDFCKICIQLLYFLLVTGLSQLVPLCSGRYFPSGKLAAWISRSNLSKASLITELSGSIDEGPLGLSS